MVHLQELNFVEREKCEAMVEACRKFCTDDAYLGLWEAHLLNGLLNRVQNKV